MILMVQWIDSCGNGSWAEAADIDGIPAICNTVGYFVKQTDGGITISHSTHHDDGTEEYMGHITIPWCCIEKMWELEVE